MGLMLTFSVSRAGYVPLATCSKRSVPLAERYGAAATFEYTSPSCAADIRNTAKAPVRHVLDCITDEESVKTCYAAMGRAGGRYVCLEACPEEWCTRKAIKKEFVMGYEIFGKRIALGGEYGRDADVTKFLAAVAWRKEMQGLLDAGKVSSHPAEVLGGGWSAVLLGLERLKKGDVKGVKLIVKV